MHYGVPIIGLPVYSYEKMNIAKAERNGYAVSIPLDELTEEKLSWALNEVLNNPKYVHQFAHKNFLSTRHNYLFSGM